jgi:hypothetical protein
MREEVKRLKGGNLSKVALGVAAAGEVVNESEGGSGMGKTCRQGTPR